MRETALAEYLPLWATLREGDVTALVTPGGDYVGGLQLGTLDVRFANEEAQASVGEALRSFVGGLDEGTTLHFLYRVDGKIDAVVRAYESLCGGAANANLKAYVAGRAAWLRSRHARRTSAYVFFSAGGTGPASALRRGELGLRLPFRRPADLSPKEHARKLKKLTQLRDRLRQQLGGVGIASRELEVDEVRRIHFELLNPSRARAGSRPTLVRLRENLWSEGTIRREGDWLREYSEAEQLAHEDLEEARGHFLHGGLYRRVCTLKVLPESGTEYFSARPLLELATRDGGEPRPFPYWLAVTVQIRSQARVRWVLNNQHRFIRLTRAIAQKLRDENVDQEEGEAAAEGSLRGLFAELHSMSSRVAGLSVSLLLEADTLEELDDATESARAAFARCGNSEFLVEDVTQLPAFLSMLPGAGPYQLRRKGATSRNAADFLPLFAAWRGSVRPYSVALTPEGDVVQLDFVDKALSSAHHGIAVGDTGSGKSLGVGLVILEALAAGVEAVLVDNGGSWRLLTELFGGTHIEVDLKTSISPFQEYAAIHDPQAGAIDNEELESVVLFLEVCLHDRDLPGLGKLQSDVLSRAIGWWYATRLRHEPSRRPLVGEFREALTRFEWTHADDRAIADDLARRLRIYCDGMYAEFLNRPSPLRFDAPLLTLDLQHVSQKDSTKEVAMAVVMQAISNRARHRRRRTLVGVDEGHEYLGRGDVAERFLAGAYRKMRKYDTAMWMLTQQFADFANSNVADAIIGNSALRVFLYHGANRAFVADYFKFSRGAREAFDRLQKRPGHYSDLLFMYGEHTTVLRHAPHPLAYWILTTDSEDKAVRERALAQSGGRSPFEVLRELASRHPHGVVGQRSGGVAA